MPLLIIAVIIVAVFTLVGAGLMLGIAYLWVLPALLLALFGHGLIKAMGKMASEGGWLSELLFYGIFWVPLMALNWLGSLLMISWTSNGHRMFTSQNMLFPASVSAWLNNAFTAILSPMTHVAYSVFGVNAAVHSPVVYASMLDSGEVECVVLISVVFLALIYPLGAMMVRNRRGKEAKSNDTAPGLV